MAESITSEGAVPTLADRQTFEELVIIPLSAAVNARLSGLFVRVETQVNRNPLDYTLEIKVAAKRDDGVVIWGLEVVSDATVDYYSKDPGFFDSLASSLANRIIKEAAKTPRRNLVERVKARSISSPAYGYGKINLDELDAMRRENDAVIARVNDELWTREYYTKQEAESQKQARLKRELEDNDIVRNESEERYALLELDLNNDKDSNKK